MFGYECLNDLRLSFHNLKLCMYYLRMKILI